MRTWNKPTLLCAVILSLFVISCDSEDGHGTTDIPAPFTPANDVQFIDALVPHHEGATEMADQVIARGMDSEVRAMATTMKDAQQREIAIMRTARQELVGAATPAAAHDPHMADEMSAMQQMSGRELDVKFLREMIPHHAGALSLAHRALPGLSRPDMTQLAEQTLEDQAREIGEMHMLLQRLAP